MVCRRCGGKPALPYERPGLPTIRAWGPFPDHEPVPAEASEEPGVGLEDNGLVQQKG